MIQAPINICSAQSEKSIDVAVEKLRQGKVIAIPTDTVYGLAALASRRDAVSDIYALKGRSFSKPLPVFVHKTEDLGSLVTGMSSSLDAALNELWPGPITFVFHRDPQGRPLYHGSDLSVAIRIPNHAFCLALLAKVGEPLVATSANYSDEPTPSTALKISHYFDHRLPLVIDGGPSPTASPSMIIDVRCRPPRLIRSGDQALWRAIQRRLGMDPIEAEPCC